MKLSEIHKKFKQLTGYYGGKPPINILTGITQLPEDETLSIWKDFVDSLPDADKPKPKRRVTKPVTKEVPKPKAPRKPTVKVENKPLLNWDFVLTMIVAPLGAFLEVFYYYYRFSMDGTDLAIALIQACSLTGFLMLTYIRGIKWLYIPLIMFSVFATSAGQSYAITENEAKQTMSEQEIAVNKELLISAKEEKKRIETSLNAIVIPRSMDTRKKYAEEVETALAEKAKYEQELLVVNKKIEDLSYNSVDGVDKENSYEFYARMLGWNPEWVQIAIHTLLSIFIALMGPVALKKGLKVVDK